MLSFNPYIFQIPAKVPVKVNVKKNGINLSYLGCIFGSFNFNYVCTLSTIIV